MEPGTKIGCYVALERLGDGAFCAVTLVQKTSTGQLFACKTVSREWFESTALLRRFEREVRLLQHFNHPNVVRLHDVVYGEEIHLIMEYCQNGDLFEYLNAHGRFKLDHAVKIFKDIVQGLEYIHGRDIAHRDIKPENIMLDKDMRAKIADFGLCHPTKPSKRLSTPCGSPFYVAPEILGMEEYDGKRGDIYSLGVLLYVMVVGYLPWNVASEEKTTRQIRSGEFTIPRFIKSPVRELIESCLSLDPEKRPTVSEILQNPWLREEDVLSMIRPGSPKIVDIGQKDFCSQISAWVKVRNHVVVKPSDSMRLGSEIMRRSVWPSGLAGRRRF
jgi:serine/threonine protein kinase